MLDSRIKRIVLTGGPCAGKTTVLADIEKYLIDQGYYVITLSEVASQLIKSNMPPHMDKEHVLIFQDIVLKTQLMKEQAAVRYAEELVPDEKVIILCDRAIMDNRAYLETQEEFEYLLNKYDLDEQEVIHSYDLVIDLISTATAKKEIYQLDEVRSEPVDDAASLDKKTTLAWIDHPRLITVKPTETIEEKSDIVISEVDKYLRGIEYNNRQVRDLGNKDIESYDSSNSKVIDICRAYLEDDLVVTNKKYRESSILILGKYNSSVDDRVITKDEFVDLIYRKSIIFTEQLREIHFTENGNVYRIVENGDKCYFDFDKTSSPQEITSTINSQFVKRKD